MNKTSICNVRGVFTGIYQWGEGWTQEVSDRWDEYLKNYKGIYWQPVQIKDTWYLVCVGGAIYLHPMDFNAVLKGCGGRCPRGHDDALEDEFGGKLDELKRLCVGLADACGGNFSSMVAQQQEVEWQDLKQW